MNENTSSANNENSDNKNSEIIIGENRERRFIKTIEIRLEGVRDATKRSRLSFLVATIASAAIFVTIYSAYFSWSRTFAFPEVPPDIEQTYSQSQKPCEKYKAALEKKLELERQVEIKRQAEIKGKEPVIKDEQFQNRIDVQPQQRFILPLQEFNKRNAATEWTKTLSISINLLGIEANISDLPVVGSFSLMVISLWFLFTVRRENKAIVALLRDVYKETKFTKDNRNSNWDIGNLAFQGAIHSLLFTSTNANDRPMSEEDIFEETATGKRFDGTVSGLTTLVRYLIFLLMLLPAIIIFVLIYTDYKSLYQCTPFREDFPMLKDIMYPNGELNYLYTRDFWIGIILGVLTLIISLANLVFQFRTATALEEYGKKLGLIKEEIR